MNNEEYLKEKTKFYFIEKGKNMESAKVFTDNENYVVCQSAPGVQVWLWTKDNYSLDEYFKMGTLKCLKPVKPNECDAYLDHLHKDDYDTAANYYYLAQNEMNVDSSHLTMEYAYEHVKNWLDNEKFWVLRNKNGKMVSVVCYDTFDNLAKLGNVYTPVEERKKGYCTNLVYYVTNMLLNNGYVPMLYTDYNYVNSNAAYKKVGYEDTGYLVNYTLKK